MSRKLSFYSESDRFNRVDVYLDGEIKKPSHYDYIKNMMHNLREVNENSTIILHMSVNGGDVNSAVALIDAIRSTKARVVANVIHCEGVGALVALACDRIRIALGGTLVVRPLDIFEDGLLELNEELAVLEGYLLQKVMTEEEFLTGTRLELGDDDLRIRLLEMGSKFLH